MAVLRTDEFCVAGHPLPRLEEVVAADFHISGSHSRRAAAEMTAFADASRKLFSILKGPSTWLPSPPETACESVHMARACGAVEIAEVGVHDGDIVHAIQ